MTDRDLSELESRLEVPIPPDLLELALTHRSYAYENGGIATNERLEFLGDAVLGLVVTDALYQAHPDSPEGQLARLRAAVVNARALADVGRTVGLGEFVRLGRGEISTGGRDKSSILADTVEAVIGAAFVGCGMDQAATLVRRLIDPLLAEAAQMGAALDWKSSLQELAAERGIGPPTYVVEGSGPPHERRFSASVSLAGSECGRGAGRTKKEAEHLAAKSAWERLSAPE